MPSLRRTPLDEWIDPAVAFATVGAGGSEVFWLDSGPSAKSGRSYIGRASRTVSSDGVGSVLEFLRAELSDTRGSTQAGEIDSGFALGWVGWLGYETRFETMGVPRDRESRYPDAAFMFVDQAIEFDHERHTVAVLTLDDGRSREPLWPVDPVGVPGSEPADAVPAHWRDSDEEYLARILECQRRIRQGDAYLLCLTTEVRVDVHPDPIGTYLALRAANPSHHGGFIRIGEHSILSSSPEQFLTVSARGAIESRPIKGTRPRGNTLTEDAALTEELRTSEKERAENLMIVDLMRNDIGRVSEIGSVTVPDLLVVESYANVHQLVSTVRGQRDAGLGAIDVITACFPAGSMTGTPKSSATRILDELERAPRGIYSGAFGYLGLDGAVDLAMTIRTIVLSPDGASIGTGGGITALSDPAEELAEVKLKAAPLLKVLGARGD